MTNSPRAGASIQSKPARDRRSAWTLATLVALTACASRSRAPTNDAREAARGASEPHAGAVSLERSCTRHATAIAPCVEECDRGIAAACVVLAARVEHGEGATRDLTRTAALLERACELHDASACVSAARMHASGSGVAPNRARQMDLLENGCALGNAAACSAPARAFANGAGVVRDPRRAHQLLERACTGGVASACEAIEAIEDAGAPP